METTGHGTVIVGKRDDRVMLRVRVEDVDGSAQIECTLNVKEAQHLAETLNEFSGVPRAVVVAADKRSETMTRCASEYRDGTGLVRYCKMDAGHQAEWCDDGGSFRWPRLIEPVEKGPLEDEIRAKCNAIAEMLCAKNRAYGSSISDPVRVFAGDLDPLAQVHVRIDDKLSRIKRGLGSTDESLRDTKMDLLGYLVLEQILMDKATR